MRRERSEAFDAARFDKKVEEETVWSPYLSRADVKKLDAVRLALRASAVGEAPKYGRVFELKPVTAKQLCDGLSP